MSVLGFTTRRHPPAGSCGHGRTGSGRCCLDWPEPDPLDRYRCDLCNCFTANRNRRHSWCQPPAEKGTP